MMSMNIDDYIAVYPDFLDIQVCEKATGYLNAFSDWTRHTYEVSNSSRLENGEYTSDKISFDDDLWISFIDIPFKQNIQDKLWFAIDEYVKNLDFKWFDGWNGYSEVRFNKYPKDTKMNLHCDHIRSIFDGRIRGVPILSLIGALNNDYQGGELYICGQQIELKAGSLVIFPSNFMYPHEVKEVTEGTRFSYVSWVY